MQTNSISAQPNKMLRNWQRLQALPAGAYLFSRLLGWYAPYSGSIAANVESLSVGFACVTMRDRRKVRNHLRSVHAIALINLGEIATGLAVLSTLPDNMRGIVLGLEAEYLKKARGKLSASAEIILPVSIEDNTAFEVKAEIVNQQGEVVTIVRANWLLGYRT